MSPTRPDSFLAIWLVAAVAASAAVVSAADRVDTIDGRTVEGQVAAIDAESVRVVTQDGSEVIARSEVASITFERPGRRRQPLIERPRQIVVETAAGDHLGVDRIVTDGDRLQLAGGRIGSASIEIGRVRSICIPGPGQRPAEVLSAVDTRPVAQPQDRLLAISDKGDMVPVAGTFKSIQVVPPEPTGRPSEVERADSQPAGEVVFTWDQQDRTLTIDRVRLLSLVVTGEAPSPAAGRLFCADGSTVQFTSLTATGDHMTLVSSELGDLSIAQGDVFGVEFYSDRVVYLSDLTPTEVTEQGLMDQAFPHRANLAVSGEGMVMDGRSYDRGLGLHSFCELTYALDAPYTVLAARAGIDDAARPNGDATLTILGDGQVLGSPIRLTGRDEAAPIRLDVTGVHVLTVRVDFGEDQLDVADHVDLAEVRLIR